jgi:glycosyltransferase involved in cell wall biosynthesis
VVKDAGILVDPLSIEGIAFGIRTLVEHTEIREKLRQKGVLRAKEFSWSETARKTGEVLRMAIAMS